MGSYNWFPITSELGPNRRHLEFSFNTNTTSNVNTALVVGIAVNATNGVNTIIYAATAQQLVTLGANHFYNKVIKGDAILEDAASPDGAYATIGNFANEGTSNPLTFTVTTFNAAGSATTFSNRRVFVSLKLRDTTVTP